jgi:hypothetical protein
VTPVGWPAGEENLTHAPSSRTAGIRGWVTSLPSSRRLEVALQWGQYILVSSPAKKPSPSLPTSALSYGGAAPTRAGEMAVAYAPGR